MDWPLTSATTPLPGATSVVRVTLTNSAILPPLLGGVEVQVKVEQGFDQWLVLTLNLSLILDILHVPCGRLIFFSKLPMDAWGWPPAPAFVPRIPSASLAAISLNAVAWGDVGLATTIGIPVSPPALMAGSIGIRPKNGIPSFSRARSPPP